MHLELEQTGKLKNLNNISNNLKTQINNNQCQDSSQHHSKDEKVIAEQRRKIFHEQAWTFSQFTRVKRSIVLEIKIT